MFKLNTPLIKKVLKFNLESFPVFLKNKIKILIQCVKKFKLKNWEFILETFKNSNQDEKENSQNLKSKKFNNKIIFIHKIIFGTNFSVIFLSNNNFQIIFDDKMELFFCKDSKTVHISKEKDFETFYALEDFLQIENYEMWKRISFINQIIKNFQKMNFKKDFIHSEISVQS